MSSCEMSIIEKQMESMSMTEKKHRNKRLPTPRYSPYTTTTGSMKEFGTNNFTKEKKQKEEAVRLGVELSLFVAEAMFLLSDDIRSMLLFCFWLFKHAGKRNFDGPVVGRLFRVIEYVFATHIKPNNSNGRVYKDGGKSIQWGHFKTYSHRFAFGLRVLDRIVSILEIGGLVKSSGLQRYNHELKKLQEHLRSVKDVSEANGFASTREAIESNILHTWKSLFETTTPSQVIINPKTRVLELFRPLVNEANRDACCRRLTSLHVS